MLDVRAMEFHLCPERGCSLPLLSCLDCRRFPCPGIDTRQIEILNDSPFVDTVPELKCGTRRLHMYIFRMHDGTLSDAPDDFNPEEITFEQLADVDEVLFIGKVFVKQLRLVPKPKAERASMLREEREATPDLGNSIETQPERRGRKAA